MNETVQLPSGATINLRKMSLRDQSHLSAAARSKRSRQEQILVDVVQRCSEGFEDPGPYPDVQAGDTIKWDQMLQGDFLAALIALRKMSFREGKRYEVDLVCPAAGCSERFRWAVDLDEDLYYQPLPADSAEKMKNGEPFQFKIQDKTIWFNLSRVGDQKLLEKLGKKFPGREAAVMIRSRISKIDGVDPKDIMNWLDGEGSGPYEGLLADEAEDIRAAFSDVDCGVDTEVEAECTRMTCGNVFSFNLPFVGMLTPGRGLARRKEARRLGADSSEG